MKFQLFRPKTDGTVGVEEVEFPQFPHCDQTILHAPGECQYCDRHPDWQALREWWRINFTGHHDPDKAPCPSTHFRSDEVRDRWYGNVPRPNGVANHG